MKSNIYYKVFLVCLSVVLIFSCKREGPTTWDSDVFVPIAQGRITLQDIVPDSVISYDENCLWHLILSEELTDFDLDSLVQIPDTTIKRGFVVPIVGGPFVIPAGQLIIDEAENNLLNIRDVELREVILESGFMEYSIKSYIDGYLLCNYNIPGVTLNGIGTSIITTTEPSIGDVPFIQNGVIDLSEHNIDLTGETGFMFNRIFTHLTIAPAANAPTPTSVSGSDSVVVELKFVNAVVRYARGYFGYHEYELDKSIDFTDQVNFPTGSLNLDQALMKLKITNSVGADAQIQFTSLSNLNSSTGESVVLNFSPLYQPINVTRAFDNGGNIQPTIVEYVMDQDNSNIDVFIENLPDFFVMEADITVNPLGNVTDGNDFIYTDDPLKATLDLDIPLTIGAQNLTFTDTLSISEALDLSADGHLQLYVNNAFPFSAMCDLFLIDHDGLLVDAIMSYGIIKSAVETNTPGITIPVESLIDMPIDDYLIDHFNPDNRVLIRVRFDTPDFNHPSGLYKNYWMDFKVIATGMVGLSYE